MTAPNDPRMHPQERERRTRRFQDRHGRTFEAIIDLRSNDAVSRVRPLFKAPWMPPDNYVRIKYDRETGLGIVDLGEDRLIADLKEAHTAWNERLVKLGYARQGDAFDPSNPTRAILNEMGPKPSELRFPLAAKKGDPWVLGKTTVVPAWAKPLIAKPVSTDFDFLNEVDAYGAVEEQHDPDAIGGKIVPVKRGPGRPRKYPLPAPAG